MTQEPVPVNTAHVPREELPPNPKAKLKDQFHEVARFKHLSFRSEKTYWEWVVRFLKFHKERAGDWQHPRDLGTKGVTPFLTYLATERDVSISTQNQTTSGGLSAPPLHQPIWKRGWQVFCRPGRHRCWYQIVPHKSVNLIKA